MRFALVFVVAFSLAATGCFSAGDGPVVVVTASYPGANAEVVADTLAAPIEQQLNGVEGMLRMESESRSDGSYVARVRFRPGPDPKLVVTLVQNRVALAKPVLPDAVQRGGIEVKLEAAKEGERNRAAIALEDRGSVDKDALQRFSATVLKRFSTEDAILKPVVFPGPAAPKLYVNVDRAKCLKLGVSLTAVFERLKAASSIAKIEDMKTLRVKSAKGDEIHLGKLATVTWKSTPPGVYRLDMYPAVRITGLPPEGKTPESAAARSAELAEEVRKNLDNPGSFAVVNLTER